MNRGSVKKTVMPNGLRIISEALPDRDSVTIGAWIEVGSRHEDPAVAGVSHFLEHMVFKGTESRSAKEIALALERLGGVLNAFTTREHTCYHARVLGDDLPTAVEILADLSTRAKLPAAEVVKERKVIAEEIKDVHDTPHEYIHDLFAEQIWPGHPIGRPVAGTLKTVAGTTREELRNHRQAFYRPDRIVIAASGGLKHDHLVRLVRRQFRFSPSAGRPGAFAAPNGPAPRRTVATRPINQTHVCVGMPTWSFADRRRYATLVANSVLGGGMSSRLFQTVREKRGLVYTIAAFHDSFQDTGFFAVYFACDPSQVVKAIDLVLMEMGRLARQPVPAVELHDAKSQLRGNLLLGLESTSSRMHRLARHELYLGRYIPPRETMKAIEAVRARDIVAMARDAFGTDRVALSILGPVNDKVLDHIDWDRLSPAQRRRGARKCA
jgi:predicted Zn-dependent peptidase